MLRVLQIPGGQMDLNNGIANFIMNVYRNIDREKIQFDFLLYGDEVGDYEDEIKKLGGRIFHVPERSSGMLENMKATFSVMKNNHYDMIHRHTAVSMSFTDFWIAKLSGIKVRICHSHGTSCSSMKIHTLLYPLFKNSMTHRLACGKEAGIWLYGDKKFFIIQKNGINTERFRFSSASRAAIRSQYRIGQDTLLLGTLGRLSPEKNQSFLLHIFAEILKFNENSMLAILGEGELREALIAEAKELNISDKVLFTGRVSNVEQWLSAMDVAVYPSLNEGFPIAVLEGEASGINSVISSGVPSEINVLGNVEQINLTSSPAVWAEQIYSLYRANKENDRSCAADKIKEAGYDIIATSKELETYYESIKN